MYVIAEIGVNHDGSVEKAKRIIDEAKRVGAHCVKFQSFKAKNLALPDTPKVAYQNRDTSSASHLDMLSRLELKIQEIQVLQNYCHEIAIDFLSTPYDVESAKELTDIGIDTFKIASADIVDFALNNYIAAHARKVFISTGMASYEEIRDTLSLYENSQVEVILLHCTSSYPTPDGEVNLLRIPALKEKFGVSVGFSDHSVGATAMLAAAAMGCTIFEKHFTLSKADIGPDHAASEEPYMFEHITSELKRIGEMMGSASFELQPSEESMRKISRKSLHWARSMDAGSIVSSEDVYAIRPNTGISPMKAPLLVGRRTIVDVTKNAPVIESEIN